MPQVTTLSDRLREAIKASDMSRGRICAETGISESMLSHFVKGRKALSMAALDRLYELFGRSAGADSSAPGRPIRALSTKKRVTKGRF